jgi:hypothetical protein
MNELEQLIDSLRYRPVATTAAQMRQAAAELERLAARVAELESRNPYLRNVEEDARYASERADAGASERAKFEPREYQARAHDCVTHGFYLGWRSAWAVVACPWAVEAPGAARDQDGAR